MNDDNEAEKIISGEFVAESVSESYGWKYSCGNK
jgi:hypothetical protein